MNPDQALSRGKLDDFMNASKDLWFAKIVEWLFTKKGCPHPITRTCSKL